MKNLTLGAARMAYEYHAGQTDLNGFPYIAHPAVVAHTVAWMGEEYEATAWLHDIIEDTEVTAETLREVGFPTAVIEAVVAISRRKQEPDEDYIRRVLANDIATAVKSADIFHNLSKHRVALVEPQERRERNVAKYERMRRWIDNGEVD